MVVCVCITGLSGGFRCHAKCVNKATCNQVVAAHARAGWRTVAAQRCAWQGDVYKEATDVLARMGRRRLVVERATWGVVS